MEYKITKEQINDLSEWYGDDNNIQLRSYLTTTLKQWFPEAFETKLEVGKWYKTARCLFCYQLDSKSFGFDNSKWVMCEWVTEGVSDSWNPQPATDSEVQAALINEAKKRGFKEGVYFTTPKMGFNEICNGNVEFLSNGLLYFGSGAIFKNGQWAEIIPTMTKEQAEEKLGCKIV